MPTVEPAEATFKRSQVQAKQLIDTISTVVDRLLDHYERDRQRPAPAVKPRRQVATGEVTAFRDCLLSIA